MKELNIKKLIKEIEKLRYTGNGNVLVDEDGSVIKSVIKPEQKGYNQAIDDVQTFLANQYGQEH